MGTYRRRFIGRGFYAVIFGAMAVASVALVVSVGTAVARSDEHLTSVAPFVLFWFVALGWNAYWWLYRIAFSVTVRDDTLAWETPLRRGSFPLTDLVALRPLRLLPSVIVIEPRVGRSVLVMPGKGIAGLAAAVTTARPGADVRVGPVSRIQEQLPGRTGWRP